MATSRYFSWLLREKREEGSLVKTKKRIKIRKKDKERTKRERKSEERERLKVARDQIGDNREDQKEVRCKLQQEKHDKSINERSLQESTAAKKDSRYIFKCATRAIFLSVRIFSRTYTHTHTYTRIKERSRRRRRKKGKYTDEWILTNYDLKSFTLR